MSLFDYEKNVALEAIDHQRNNKEFKEDLVEQIDIIKSKLKDKVYNNSKDVLSSGIEVNKISDTIYGRTGIRLKFINDNSLLGGYSFNASIQIYYDNALNPLNTINNKEAAIEIFESIDKTSGSVPVEGYSFIEHKRIRSVDNTIDTKQARVSGPINNVPLLTIVDFKGLLDILDMTAGELSAIIMHEVGHAFTYLLFNDRLATLNESLQNVVSIRKGYSDEAKLSQMIKSELKDIDRKVTDKEVENLLSNNHITSTSAFFSFVTRNLDIRDLSLYLVPKAANYNSETIADSFASRMGFGVELVQAMDKIQKVSKDIIEKTSDIYITIGLIQTTAAIVLMGAAFGLAAGSLLLLRIMMIFHIQTMILTLIADRLLDMFPLIYKPTNERFRKVYNNEVDRIKQLDLTNQERLEIISNLKIIKTVIGNRKDQGVTLAQKLYTTIFRSRGNELSYDIQQDMLEKLANNELFVKALQLEMLGEK